VPEDGGPVRVVPGPTKVTNPPWIRFTEDGTAVLTKPPEEACIRLSSVPDGQEIRRFDPVPPAVQGTVAPPSAAASLASLRWAALPQGLLFWWVPGSASPGARVPYGLWPYDGGPPTRVGSWPAGTYSVDRGGSRLLARRGPGLFLRPLFADEDVVERLVATPGNGGARFWRVGFSPRGDRVWSARLEDETGRLSLWSIEPGASAEPRVFSVPNPDGNFAPAWDPAGTRVAWGSSAEKTVWLWDLGDPPEAAATALRRPDMMATKQAAFAPDSDWLAVMHQGTLTFWALAQPRARVLTGRGHIPQLVFARDSQSLLSCGQDEVRLWPLAPEGGAARRVAADFQGWCQGAALAPDSRRIVLVGSDGVWLAPSAESRGRWLMDGGAGFLYSMSAAAWDASGQRIAAVSFFAPTESPQSVFLFDPESANERRWPLTPPGETSQAWDWGVRRLAFTPDGRLVMGGSGGVRWLDTDTGASRWIWRLPREIDAWIAVSADGHRLVAAAQARDEKAAPAHGVVLVDLASGVLQPLLSHGRVVTAVALDTTGRTVVTGDEEGAVRVGLADGSEPHRLCCHSGRVNTISLSPDGKWIASASGGEIRLWPMSDLTKPPLHTLPHDELMAKLRALTNLQVVEDAASPTGYRLDIGPFPGWKDVPTW
jgi:WD40 repeat protein